MPSPRTRIRMITVFVSLCLLYVLLVAAMWHYQRRLLYFPTHDVLPPAAYGLTGFEERAFPASGGISLAAWHHPPRAGYPLILYLHGNGGHLGHRADIYAALAEAGFGVLALEWRGYGKSQGTPTEEGLYADARAAIGYAGHALGTPPSRLLLYGESLGTGVAVRMASEFPVAAIALQAPYTSIYARGAEIYPWLPVRLLARDRYDSLRIISSVRAPLLILHGERDDIVPIAHGKALLAAASMPKEAMYFPEYGHVDFPAPMVAETLKHFAAKYNLLEE